MSIIIKNGHKTIATLSSFTISGQTYYCCGIVPSGAYWALPLHSSDAMRVLISATVNASTRGYLFGDERFSIQFNSSNQVVWSYNGGSISVPLELGAHTYGFIDGRPFYDGELLINETITAAATENVCYLASANNPYPTPLSNAKIKRVEIYGHETNATDSKKIWSYYATKNGTTGYLVEKWSNSIVTNTGGSIGSDVKYITYGIGINDLRNAVNTSYHDLVAIYTQDGGVVSPNYYAPEVVVNDNDSTDTHEMAFRWIGRSLPSGYTKQTHPVYDTDSKGIDGELLLGRQPKWNMWADNVNMGRYIYMYDYTGTDQTYRTTLRFNPLVDKYGQDKEYFRLEDWENYSPTLFHKPDLRVGNLEGQEMPNFTMEIVNGLEVSTNSNLSIQKANNSSGNIYWHGLYKYQRSATLDGDLSFVIGNMISWHEEGCSYYDGYDDTGTPIAIPVFGGYFAIRIGNGLYEEESEVVVDGTTLDGTIIMIGFKAEDTTLDELNKVTDAATIYAYREGGIKVGSAALANMGDGILNLIRQYASSHDNIIPCFAEFGLLAANKTYIETAGGTPPLNTLISGRLLAPMKQVQMTLDEKQTNECTFFINGFGSNLSVCCDTNGYSQIIQRITTTGTSYTEGITLGMLVQDDNGDYVQKSITATLTAYWYENGVFEVKELGTVTSKVKSELEDPDDPYYYNWLRSGVALAYKNGASLGNVYSSCIATDIAQILIWEINSDAWAGLTYLAEDYIGALDCTRIKDNISLVISIDKIGDEDVVEKFRFSIGDNRYFAVEGMTWETWVDSPDNTSSFSVYNNGIVINIDGEIVNVQTLGGVNVTPTETIVSQNYILSI